MKITRSFLLMMILLFSVKGFSQKTFNEGVLTYKISGENIKTGKPFSGSLNGAVLTVYLNGNKSYAGMVSAPGSETVAFDENTGKGFILKEYSAQKLMITLSSDNLAKMNHLYRSLNFQTEAGTTEINNYTCKKAVATAPDGKIYTVYFDPNIVIANKTYNNAFPQIAGLPVRYQLQSGDMVFNYDLGKYSTESIAASKFDAPKTGFRVMSFDENQQLKKGE